MDTQKIPEIAERYMGAIFNTKEIKCVTFCSLIYREAGLPFDLSLHPRIIDPDNISDHEIGKIIFLMNKKRPAYLFSHIGIVYDYQSIIHYSRHMSLDNVRRVQINSFCEILEVYDLVFNPYNKNIIKTC
jgi:hypothetical protein